MNSIHVIINTIVNAAAVVLISLRGSDSRDLADGKRVLSLL